LGFGLPLAWPGAETPVDLLRFGRLGVVIPIRAKYTGAIKIKAAERGLMVFRGQFPEKSFRDQVGPLNLA